MIEKEIYTAKNDPTIDLGIAIEQAYRKHWTTDLKVQKMTS